MNRDKIVDIATKLPREAYIDLLCAGAENLTDYEVRWSMQSLLHNFPNLSYNQANALIEAYREEGKEEEYERPGIPIGTYCDPFAGR